MSDTQATGSGESQDSEVIRTLRQQVKDLQNQLKNQPDVDAEVRRQVARREAARAALGQLGAPAQLAEIVLDRVEDEVTDESVASVLESLGLTPQSQEPVNEKAKEVSQVSGLAAQVASAAGKGGAEPTVTDELNQAQSKEEVAAIMARAGLSQ